MENRLIDGEIRSLIPLPMGSSRWTATAILPFFNRILNSAGHTVPVSVSTSVLRDETEDKPGRFKLAEGGTILLDEIGDISTALQLKLLRVLQEKEYEPLGAVATVKADVRVIAATNKILSELVDRGSFREDLFYRLNSVYMPK